jgi:hypothetical protein
MYKDKLSKILRTNNIKDCNLEYYYTKYPEWFQSYNLNPMFDDIGPFEYDKPLSYLNYDKYTINIAKKYADKKSIFKRFDDKKNQIMLEYIKCRPLINLITIWCKVSEIDLLEYLQNFGNVYCIKHIKLNTKAAQNLLYQLFADSDKCKDIESINKQLLDVYRFEGGLITVVVFDNLNKEHPGLIKKDLHNVLEKKGTFFMTTKFYQTVEHAQIYFCENSLKFLESQLLDRHIGIYMRKSRILLATFKRWMCKNLSLKQRRNILLLSGSILYCYGIRNLSDIDMYIDQDCYSNEIEKYILNPDTKFHFVDARMPNTNTWIPYWNKWGVKWAQLIGANNFDEIIYNPNYHFYYMGMKFMILDGDIQRRLIRQRPKAICDLVKINQLLGYNIKIPNIPSSQKKYIRLNKNECFVLDKNQSYNQENNEIEYDEKIDKDIFLRTMKWHFEKIYHEVYEIENIKTFVGIKKIRIKKI